MNDSSIWSSSFLVYLFETDFGASSIACDGRVFSISCFEVQSEIIFAPVFIANQINPNIMQPIAIDFLKHLFDLYISLYVYGLISKTRPIEISQI